ncbi:hypothetical protein JYG23_04400 [Sedimentibacter sp. zth1]|uniref:hypothetical protein n=1 Tax=Sedimentibacter sp. zth1 TaxID=2816908 RepID=UPI001A9231B5|nr:hypothetical protein [Sedimentibacter sp. zth1]QSX06700.1 hypothetical protein JYG23_04400 [Sedimentibacter sp. zth1]
MVQPKHFWGGIKLGTSALVGFGGSIAKLTGREAIAEPAISISVSGLASGALSIHGGKNVMSASWDNLTSGSEGTGKLANKISKSDLFSNYKKVEDKLKTLKDPNGNYARMAKDLGYDDFNIDSWKKGIQSFKSDGVRIEYHFVKNIDDGTVIGEKIFRVIDGTREYLDILP